MELIKHKKRSIISRIRQALPLSFVLSILFCQVAFASSINQEHVINLINQERKLHGLSDLSINSELNRAGQMKSKDMLRRNYFEHYAFGITPWDFIRNAGYNYISAGENLAMNFNTSEGMVRAWMNSPAHRENILNPNFSDTGVGIVKGSYQENGNIHETIMVTSLFGQKKSIIENISEKVRSLFPLY